MGLSTGEPAQNLLPGNPAENDDGEDFSFCIAGHLAQMTMCRLDILDPAALCFVLSDFYYNREQSPHLTEFVDCAIGAVGEIKRTCSSVAGEGVRVLIIEISLAYRQPLIQL